METFTSILGGGGDKMSKFILACLLIIVVSYGAQCYHVPSSEPSYSHHFDPYSYGYETEDNYGNKQWRQERSSHPQEVHGSYGYRDKNGVYREVTYTADHNGFRANIKTNEPGVSGASDKTPASTKIESYYSPPPPPMAVAHQHYTPSSYHHQSTAASPPVYTRQHYTSGSSYYPAKA